MCQDFPDRPRISDEANQPDIATTVGTRQRKRLTHPCQQFRPGNPRRVMMARQSINTSIRTAAAVPNGSGDTARGPGTFTCLRVPLRADIPDGKRRDCFAAGDGSAQTPRDTDAGAAGAAGSALPAVPGTGSVCANKRCLSLFRGPAALCAEGVRHVFLLENKPDPHVERRHHLRPVCQYVLQAIERKRRPGTVTQQMFQALEEPRHVPVSKRDSYAVLCKKAFSTSH